MGGGGGGKGGGASSGPSPELEATRKFFREDITEPLAKLFIPQVEEALQTGGIGARLPIAQRGVEAARSGTSQALQTTEERLGRANLVGTPFGERILSETALKGATATERIPVQIAEQLANLAPELITGAGRVSVSGAGTVSETRGATPDLGLFQAGGQIGAASAPAIAKALGNLFGPTCWIALVLYGGGSREFDAAYYWVNFGWQGKIANACRWLYRRCGLATALWLEWHPQVARYVFKPIFDIAVRKGKPYTNG